MRGGVFLRSFMEKTPTREAMRPITARPMGSDIMFILKRSEATSVWLIRFISSGEAVAAIAIVAIIDPT